MIEVSGNCIELKSWHDSTTSVCKQPPPFATVTMNSDIPGGISRPLVCRT